MSVAGEILKNHIALGRSPMRRTRFQRWASGGMRLAWCSFKAVVPQQVWCNPRIQGKIDNALNSVIRKLDAFLRYCQQIEEFVQHRECLLRISLTSADSEVVLSEDSCAHPGDLIGELHIWNEHIVPTPNGGADLAWAILMRHRMTFSLTQLAECIETEPRFARIKLFRAETALGTGKSRAQAVRVAEWFGFQVTEAVRPDGWLGEIVAWGESIYLWGMARAFNRGALKNGSLVKPQWIQFWISRDTLVARYGTRRLDSAELASVRPPEPARWKPCATSELC